MKNIKDINVLFIDSMSGSVIDHACKCAKECKGVYYFTDWKMGGMPTFDPYFEATNVPGITRVENLYEMVMSEDPYIDLFVFAGCYDGDLLEYLKKNNRLTYGSGYGQELELDRVGLKKLLEKLGLKVTDYVVKNSVDEARKYLDDKKNLFIKISKLRGIGETQQWKSKKLTSPWLNKIEYDAGILARRIQFIIEKPIGDNKTACEYGQDLWTASGLYPETFMCGAEIKNCLYLAKMGTVKDFPPSVKEINEKFSDVFRHFNYNGSFHVEIRQMGKDYYPIDFTARMGFPPSSLMFFMFDNPLEILYKTALGEVCEPKTKFKYGLEMIGHSRWAQDDDLPIYIDPKVRDNVFVYSYTMNDGIPTVLAPLEPSKTPVTVASICCGGNSVKEVMELGKEIAGKIESMDVDFCEDMFKDIENEIELMDKLKVNFF